MRYLVPSLGEGQLDSPHMSMLIGNKEKIK